MMIQPPTLPFEHGFAVTQDGLLVGYHFQVSAKMHAREREDTSPWQPFTKESLNDDRPLFLASEPGSWAASMDDEGICFRVLFKPQVMLVFREVRQYHKTVSMQTDEKKYVGKQLRLSKEGQKLADLGVDFFVLGPHVPQDLNEAFLVNPSKKVHSIEPGRSAAGWWLARTP